jgi:hypothetical protein
VDVAELGGLGERGGEPQPPRLQGLGEQLGQARLEERYLPRGEFADLPFVDVHAQDLEAQDGHADRMGGTEVAGADDGEPGGLRRLHRGSLSLVGSEVSVVR